MKKKKLGKSVIIDSNLQRYDTRIEVSEMKPLLHSINSFTVIVAGDYLNGHEFIVLFMDYGVNCSRNILRLCEF